MSIYFKPTKPMSLLQIQSSKFLAEVGVEVVVNEDKQYLWLDDQYLHFDMDANKDIYFFASYGRSNPEQIIGALQIEFGRKIHNEFEDEYCEKRKVGTVIYL